MTEEENRRNRWVDRGISLALVIIGILGTSWASGITTFNEKLDSKASKKYVDEQINLAITNSEKVNAAKLHGITILLENISNQQAETRHDIKEILKNQK